MKSAQNKQRALKGLLLLVLAADLTAPIAMKSLNLSSETKAPVAANTASAPAAAPATPPANAVSTSDSGPKPDAPATTSTATVPTETEHTPHIEAPKICGQRFYVTYREIVPPSGETMTEIYVRPHTGVVDGFRPITYRVLGGFDTNLDKDDVKKENDSKIAELVKSRLGRCVSDLPAPEAKSATQPLSKEDRESIQRGMKECRLNSKGDPLTEVQQTRCRLKTLESVDTGDRDDRGARSRAMNEIERIVKGDLRKSIKNRLMSNDESKVEEGEELLDSVIEDVKESATELDLDTNRTARLVSGLESLRAGGETYRRSVDLENQVKDAKTEMSTELRQALDDVRSNPGQPWAQQRLMQVEQENLQLQRQLQNQMQMDIINGPYNTLLAAQRMGNLNSGDFSQFTQPYQMLNRDLQSMLDLRGMISGNGIDPALGNLGSLNTQMPSDFMSYRTSLAGTFQRNYGVGVPARPANLTQNSFGPVTGGQFTAPMSAFNSMSGSPLVNSNSSLLSNPGYGNSLAPSGMGGNRWP